LANRLTPPAKEWRSAFMSNEDMNPRRPLEKSERKRIGILEPFKFGKLPGFWLYLFGAIVLTSVVAVGGAWLLVRMGVQ
jgi:hypothetical protein